MMRAARTIDEQGAKAARHDIAMIKAVVPLMAQRVIDSAMQSHGAGGKDQEIASKDFLIALPLHVSRQDINSLLPKVLLHLRRWVSQDETRGPQK